MTVKFEKWWKIFKDSDIYINASDEEDIENAFTAGDKNGRKRILEELLESYGQSARDGGISAEDLYEALIERIDTELEKLNEDNL